MLYIKEITCIKEIFYDKYPKWLNYIIYLVKYVCCILTIKNENKCYIPYKKLKSKIVIKLILYMLKKQNVKIVLSKQLLNNNTFMEEIIRSKIQYINGDILFDYNILKILEYIAKVKNKEVKEIEATILINNILGNNINMVKYLALNIKRLNIVTNNLDKFRKVEEELQDELGIPILVTNSKRKSLLKAEIIINIDFSEELLELYQINRNAIVVQKEKQNINKKSFNGINVIDYELDFENDNTNVFYKQFIKKDLLLSIVDINKNYIDVIEQLKNYDVKVVNVVGNKGIISIKEF